MNSRLRSQSRMSPRPLSLARSPLAMSPRASMAYGSPSRLAPLMSPRASMAYGSPSRLAPLMSPRASMAYGSPSQMMSEPLFPEESYDNGMMLKGLVSVLGLIAIAVGIFHLVTDPVYKPDMSAEEMDKHKNNRNTWGYVLLGVGIVAFLGLAGNWMNSRMM